METAVRAVRDLEGTQRNRRETVNRTSGRLVRLRAACPGRAVYLSFALASFHNRAVYGMLAGNPAEAHENARRAIAYAADHDRADPDTRGAYPSADADFLTRMRTELLNRYPDIES